MQSTNNWKEELKKMECVFTNCDLWDMADRGGDSLPILYRDEVETFIQSLLDTRTRECAEIAEKHIQEGKSLLDIGSEFATPRDYRRSGNNQACQDIADEIKSKFIQ